ncbi:MAG: hypothetical protein Q9162_006967 [Coniocarpon cinnabarinum]
MASHPPGQCCTVGVKHEGTPKGEITKVGEYESYISHPENKATENAVLILTDVLGHKFINLQLIADQFAANGYFVVMPDLFYGDSIPVDRPDGFDMKEWLSRHGTSTVDPICTSVIKAMRTKLGVKHIGSTGYCFGAKYVARFMGQIGQSHGATIDAGFMAHPSFVDNDELSAINGPLSIAAAETDQIFPEEKRHESEGILKKLAQGDKKLAYQINLYSSVAHGFAVKTDLADKRNRFAKEQAFIQAVQWFDHFLKA